MGGARGEERRGDTGKGAKQGKGKGPPSLRECTAGERGNRRREGLSAALQSIRCLTPSLPVWCPSAVTYTESTGEAGVIISGCT